MCIRDSCYIRSTKISVKNTCYIGPPLSHPVCWLSRLLFLSLVILSPAFLTFFLSDSVFGCVPSRLWYLYCKRVGDFSWCTNFSWTFDERRMTLLNSGRFAWGWNLTRFAQGHDLSSDYTSVHICVPRNFHFLSLIHIFLHYSLLPASLAVFSSFCFLLCLS